MSLVARHLEANGIPTVILGSARDIVDYCGVPRFLFTDFPLGNPCGKPWDVAMQQSTVTAALGLLESASEPRTTERSPHRFTTEDERWRKDFLRIDPAERDNLLRLGERRRRRQRAVRSADSARKD